MLSPARGPWPWLLVTGLCSLAGAASACHAWRSAEVDPDDARLVYLGAFNRTNPMAPRFAWPATEVRLSFVGNEVSADLTDTPFEDETRQTDWIAVQLDQAPVFRIALVEGRKSYELARKLPPGMHTLRLMKRTEAEVGTITLHGFRLSKGATPRPSVRPQRRILFVGDSITAGYGDEGASETCHYSPATSDATRTFATLAARELGAEALVSAWSGKGVLRNYEAADPWTMPMLFMRTLPGEPKSVEFARQPTPDVIVVALGSNDMFRGMPDEAAFLGAYRGLLDRLAKRAPGVPLVLVLSPMLADDYPQPNARSAMRRWLETLQREREQAGTKVTLLEQWMDPVEGLGCDFHPNLRSHERLGHELSEALRKLCGWKD